MGRPDASYLATVVRSPWGASFLELSMAQPGLSPEQLDRYAAEGVVRLPGAVPAADIAALADVVWRRLRVGHGIVRDRPATWTIPHPAQLAARTNALAPMASPAVRAVLDQMLGPQAWVPPERWGLPLVTLPGFADRWDVPHKNWHLDLAAAPEPPRVARIFILLADHPPAAGATGYVAGSHRVVRMLAAAEGRTLRSGEIRARLAEAAPWFASLFARPDGSDRRARFMERPGEAMGVPVRVGEMWGQAGDAWFMDPHVLHATMPNAAATPRMMLTEWIHGDDAVDGP
jgi:ectoine hydroxylase-related dioxygenase (phytanoyl-CoA dioxygenase family)